MTVYFVQAGRADTHIKIGVTKNVFKRVWQLQAKYETTIWILAVMDGYYEMEAEMHTRFQHINTGGEWFLPAPDLIDFIKSLPCPREALKPLGLAAHGAAIRFHEAFQ